MLRKRNRNNNKDAPPERKLPTTEPLQLRAYYVRLHDASNDLKLKMKFAGGSVFPFNAKKQMNYRNTFGPFIYVLDLALLIDNEKLFVLHDGCQKEITEYHLEMSHPIRIYGDMTHVEKGSEGHSLMHCFDQQHCFLLGIRFASTLTSNLPGTEINVFTEFCLFTCYLLQSGMTHIFDTLVDQLHFASPTENNILNTEQFHEFFETCRRYLSDVWARSNEKSAFVKVTLRMIGVLSIEKEGFDRFNIFSTAFANEIMPYVRTNFANLYQIVNEEEWLLFKSGLIVLLSIELSQYKFSSSNENKVDFLLQILDETRRQDTAYELLDQLVKLDQPIFGDSNWTDLFTIVDPTKINIHQLNLANSFETLIICITKISKVLVDYSIFEEKIERYLEDRILSNCIEIDLESIIYLLKFLEQKLSDNLVITKHLLSAVQVAIRMNGELKHKITDVLSELTMTTENMDKIWLIICSTSKFPIFQYFDQYQYLEKSLLNVPSSDYYIQWAQWFLAKSLLTDEIEKKKLKRLFDSYINRLKNDSRHLADVLILIDDILNAFDKSDDRLYFIDRMIDLCFEQSISLNSSFSFESIFFLIANGLFSVQNDLFREQFRKKFDQKYLIDKQQDIFKDMTDQDNPLPKLIELDKQLKIKSLLIRDLIELICEKISVTKDELMQDTFYQPAKFTLIYLMLFDESFMLLPVHKQMIEQLKPMWEEWERDGFQVAQINSWSALDTNKQQIACQIWNLVGTYIEKTVRFEQLINNAKRKIEEITKTMEDATLCINNYCQDAHDRNEYLTDLQNLQNQLNQATTYSAKISPKIERLKEPADRLRPVISSTVWQEYLKPHREAQDKSQLSCLETLEQVRKILDQFIARLTDLCTDTKQPLLPQLQRFFPQKHFIGHEFKILKPLLTKDTVLYLDILLEYWKGRELINHICKGWQILLSLYNSPTSAQLTVLQQILDIDDQTFGETCITVYQDYRNHYSTRYSSLTLELIAQWSKSNELLIFLNELKPSDIDNLLEIVNDWDETSINTETVFGLVLLKKILGKINTKIDSIYQGKSLEPQNIIPCFEQILPSETERKEIISTMESCYKNLPNIKRIRMESENKEQSKRKRILDIMKKSSFSFCLALIKEKGHTSKYQFDVNVTNDAWQPISFDDLTDLRDRARLTEYESDNSDNIKLKSFISLVDIIEGILQSSTALYEAGYPVVKRYYDSPKTFTCHEDEYQELDVFKAILEVQLEEWEQQLCTMYKQCVNLTYFSHQQISMVDDAVREKTIAKSNDSTYHLLKFIGVDPQSIDMKFLPEEYNHPLDLLRTMAFLVKTDHHTATFSTQEDERKNKKIFLVETTNKGILRAIYSLCHLNDTSPAANQLFYCTKKTNWMEIRAFIYRCFYSQKLHQLIQPEMLSIVIQDQFTELLYQLIIQSPNHLFRLGIITTVPTAHLYLINNFNAHHIMRIVHDQEMLSVADLAKRIRESIGENCTLVTSEIAGLGKSTFIQNEALRLGKTCVKFPISGHVDTDKLTAQLRDEKIQSASSSIIIHIDIGPVQNVQQLNELIYCLVLFRCFRLGQMPVCIQTNIPIYIELDSSSYLSNVKDELVILQYLNTKHIVQMDWNELRSDSLAVQLVVRYLLAIEHGRINTKNIDENTTEPMNKPICISLLQKHFLDKKNSKFISWTQLSIFTSVYYKLFSSFSKCGYFFPDPDTPSSLRNDILTSLLHSSNQFTSLSVEAVRQNQRSIYSNESSPPFSEAIIRWDKSELFTLIFTFYNEPLFIYKTLNNVPSSLTEAFRAYYNIVNKSTAPRTLPKRRFFSFFPWLQSSADAQKTTSSVKTAEEQLQEFFADPNQMTHEQFFVRLTLLSTKYLTLKSICPTCYSQYDYEIKKCNKCPTADILIKPASKDNQQDIENFQKQIAKKLHSEYVLTADNYIKMLLIYLRVQSNLPVLIMGETGCGKTALIQCLCQKILDDDMEVFRIHAGVTNDMIIETMQHFIKKAQKCFEQDSQKRLWVFLDEFNTTPNIGLLKEIVCERTLLGEQLPENMVFLGACNPQRRRKNKTELEDDISIKKYHLDVQRLTSGVDSSLLYSVVPIPETMLEHVWDYGYLDQATEKSYIKTVVRGCEQLTTNGMWLKCIVNAISASQNFFRERDDVSSVSLRDVARFCRFYKWFYGFPSQCKFVTDSERASLLALFFCYYFRLNSTTDRNDYLKLISQSIKESKPNLSPDVLDNLLNNEKLALVEQMELPPGTAKNRALTDNIFVLFTAIVNRIPVILCGKPGSSKTSAVQIIISNLKGEESKNPFFQKLPGLTAISYQGSHNCTSESIIKVFAQADKCAQAKSKAKLLPVIVFDEIGLAELSPHNPLKVLHSELEIETCRHAFVGLSNWRLDASKMNRAIYLSCPDLNTEDLQKTAVSLSESMLSDKAQAVPLNASIIEGLAIAYTKLCEHMKKHRNQHFFGLRDYYSLIKGIVYDSCQKENRERDLYEIIRHQLSFNFDGVLDGSKFMWSRFCEETQLHHQMSAFSSPKFDQLIDRSLSSRNGRFLMLIGNNENEFDYVQRYINTKHISIQTRTLIGSTLPGDLLSNSTYSEQYNTRILMDIIRCAEKEITLFLRGLGHLYDNLYDLFNQNFAVSEKKKFCRIALGSLYHPRCVIHDSFYCVVFVKRDDLEKYDPPFLNRFEKHLIEMENLIDERHETVMKELNQFIKELLSGKPNGSSLVEKHLFLEFTNDYILNLVTAAFDRSEDRDYCQDQMIRTSSFDLPLLLSIKPQTDDGNLLLQRYYQIHDKLSFPSFIQQMLKQEKIPPLLIYTYTQISQMIDYREISTDPKSIEEVKLSHFKTELELIQKIKMHYQSISSRLLFIRVDYHRDQEHLPMLKHILLNEQIPDENHGICLIFHLQRNRLHQTTNEVFFTGWSSVMIDDLQKHQLIPHDILLNPSYGTIINHLKFLQAETAFDELIEGCNIKFRYTVANQSLETEINKHRLQVIQQFTREKQTNDHELPSLRSLAKKYLSEMIENSIADPNQTQLRDWRRDLLTNEIVIGSCRSINDALTKTVSYFLETYLSLLLAHLEKYALIDSHLFVTQSNGKTREKLRSLWLDCWTKSIKTIDMSIITQNYIEIPLVFDLHLPCATIEYEIIRQIRHTIAQQRHDDDDDDDAKNRLDFAYKQLISTSVYGPFINTILSDPELFDHYYQDQLTLTRNEANIHNLSTLFVQRLLTSKISGTDKDRLRHLLIDYDELWEIMRIFEISTPLIGEGDASYEIFDQQEKSVGNTNQFYRLVIKESQFYLIHPGSSEVNENVFECNGDPFIEVSLMNLLELLISPSYVDRIMSIKQLIRIYSLVIQNMISLTHYGHYDINNLEKVDSLLRLASCLSTLFLDDQARTIFIQIYRYHGFSISFNTRDDLYNFIHSLKNIIKKQQPTVNESDLDETLLKFESELLRNWSISNTDQSRDILQCIHDHQLWKYAAKTFTLIDKQLVLSETAEEYSGRLAQNEEYESLNQYLSELGDSTYQLEVLIMMRIYIQLIFDENYQSRINEDNRQHINEILNTKFDDFEENLSEIERLPNEQRLQRLSLIAWCRYYLLHYVYALKYDIKDDIMSRLDRILIENDSAFSSTVKLSIIKQLCDAEHLNFFELCHKYTNRNLLWIRPMITPSSNQQTLTARRKVILPMPLVECCEEFKRIDQKLTSHMTIEEYKALIIECTTKQDTAYCFLIWFIHYYTRFYVNNILPDTTFVNLIENILREELTNCFQPIGYQLICSLCTNFHEQSFFHLEQTMSEEELHQRLLVVNIIALLLSFKSTGKVSLLSFLLFDSELKMPENYSKHFEKFDSLTGVALSNNPALIRMLHIRTQIEQQQLPPKTNILRCSSECPWLFYSINGNIPNECPLCKKSRNQDKPQSEMEILQFIARYIEQQKKIIEKPNRLAYHFIDFFTKSIFLYLNEAKHIPYFSSIIRTYFRESLVTSYQTIRQDLSNIDQSNIWLYKLFNHMMNEQFLIPGYLTTPEKVIQLEKLIEEKLIFPHTNSFINEIKEYKSLYSNLIYGTNQQETLVNFIDELIETNPHYPFLHFFNMINIHSIDLLDDCYTKLRLRINHEQLYPLTTFILPRLSNYDTIPYLHPIITFTNRLMQQLNHRIKRDDAKKKSIGKYIQNDSVLESSYHKFLDVWSKHRLEKFDRDSPISMFLLNKSKDNDSLILLTSLQTLVQFQNEIVNCYIDEEHLFRTISIPIQSIQQRHLFQFNRNEMRKFLIEKCLMINCQSGMSEEMIYNYDEIEWKLRSEINCLPRIDIENMQYFNYQFELYDENVSLINHIRERFEQKFFDERKRLEIERFLDSLDNDSILQLSGSLEYILVYLRSVTNENKVLTIQAFIRNSIHSELKISEKLGREPFASINLEYIIDLHEMIEECVFEKIFYENIKSESVVKGFNETQLFLNEVINGKMADCFKDLTCWINMFKRLLVRLRPLKSRIDFDLPLSDYVKRTDMWKGNITKENLQTIEIKNNIRLKHAFSILEGLKAKRLEMDSADKPQDSIMSGYERTYKKTTPTPRPVVPVQSKKPPLKKRDIR